MEIDKENMIMREANTIKYYIPESDLYNYNKIYSFAHDAIFSSKTKDVTKVLFACYEKIDHIIRESHLYDIDYYQIKSIKKLKSEYDKRLFGYG